MITRISRQSRSQLVVALGAAAKQATVKELRAACKALGVKGYSRKKKAWLLKNCVADAKPIAKRLQKQKAPTVAELRQMCKAREVKGYSGKKKAWLMQQCGGGTNHAKPSFIPEISANVLDEYIQTLARGYKPRVFFDELPPSAQKEAWEWILNDFVHQLRYKPGNEDTLRQRLHRQVTKWYNSEQSPIWHPELTKKDVQELIKHPSMAKILRSIVKMNTLFAQMPQMMETAIQEVQEMYPGQQDPETTKKRIKRRFVQRVEMEGVPFEDVEYSVPIEAEFKMYDAMEAMAK